MGGGDDHDAFGFPVEDEAKVKLLLDVRRAFDPEAIDALAIGIGLLGDKLLAEEGGGEFLHLGLGPAEFHPARRAAAAGMDLRLDDPGIAAQFAGAIACLFGAVGQAAARDGHAEAGEDFLGLIFVNVHSVFLPARQSGCRL